MKSLTAALTFVFAAAPALLGQTPANTSLGNVQGPHPFNVRDLVMMDRVSDPQLSPDGRYAAFTVRRTDYAANRGITAIYVKDLSGTSAPVQVVDNATQPRWAPDGHHLYYMAAADGVEQLWRVDLGGANGLDLAGHAAPTQVSHTALDLNTFKLSPDGSHVLLSYEVDTDCPTLACTAKGIAARAADKASGTLYTRLFVRHWDTWATGRRNQLYIAAIDSSGRIPTEPTLLSKGTGAPHTDGSRVRGAGMDGDIPSKPFGDESEFSFSPNGKTVYFGVRIAGSTEAWSTNFDVYSVPADGSAPPNDLTAANKAWDAYPVASPDGNTLYYLAMKLPGVESDRFGIMALDLATGDSREIDPGWDRSPGGLTIAPDGKTLYASVDDNGEHPIFAIDIATGKATRIVGDGTISGYSLAHGRILFARDDLKHPSDLYTVDAAPNAHAQQVTHFNADALSNAKEGDWEFFTFKGWNGETVQSYVVKPVGFEPGKRYPVAFLIHGGPQGAWDNGWSYRWNPQTYAGQGFAVVAINFHGSTGYGQAFTNSISGDWGGKPLEDLKLGWAAALGKYPFLDGSRACALGASYGGYMTYWIAGVWNTPWKCLVDHDGVFDTRAMYYDTEELWFEERENGGTQYEHPENYEKFNPLDHVKDWRVPMLVVHSNQDFRIPINQGMGAFTALQRRGIPSEFLTFPDENHWVLKPHNSVQWHDAVNAWLARWTAPLDAGSPGGR